MQESDRGATTIRAFLALDPPEALKSEVERWQRGAGLEEAGLRAVPVESLHLTLAFMGRLDERLVPSVVAILERLPRDRVELELGRAVLRPRRRPRLVAAQVESEGARMLAERAQAELAAAGLVEPPSRAVWPHLTMARRRGRGVARMPGGSAADLAPVRGDAVRLALYRSDLRPEGSRYTALATIDLPCRGAGGRKRGECADG